MLILIILLFATQIYAQTLQIAQIVDAAFGANVTVQRAAMQLWMDHLFNNAQSNMPQVNILNMTVTNGQAGAISNVLEVIMDQPNTLSVISGFTSSIATVTILSALAARLPVCSGSASSPIFASRETYPNFFRFIPSDIVQGVAVVRFIAKMGWKNFALIFDTQTYGRGLADVVRVEASKMGIEVFQSVSFTSGQLSNNFQSLVIELSSTGSAIFVVVCYEGDFFQIMQAAEQLNLIKGYVWIGTDSLALVEPTSPVAKYMNGVIITSPVEGANVINDTEIPGATPMQIEFGKLWMTADPEKYPGAGTDLPTYTWLFMDCAQALVLGIQRFVQEQGVSWQSVLNGEYTEQLMGNDVAVSFNFPTVQGATGLLALNKEGGPVDGQYLLLNWRSGSGSIAKRQARNWIKVGHYSEADGIVVSKGIVYPGTSDPTITPPPGMVTNLSCQAGSGTVMLASGAVVCATCSEGTYNRDSLSICHICPNGAICNGGTDVRSGVNFWMNPAIYNPPSLYDCQDQTPCCLKGNCTEATQCPGTSFGLLCSECPSGTYPWSNQCVTCDTGNVIGIFFLIAFLSFIIVVLLVALSRESNVIVSEISFFYQIAFLFADNGLKRQVLGIFGGDSSQVATGLFSCIAPVDGFGKMMLQFAWPTFIVVEFLLFWLFCLLWRRYRTEFMTKIERVFLPQKIRESRLEIWFRTGLIVVVLFVFLPYVRPSLNVFNCRKVAGQDVNRLYPSVECFEGAHIGVMVFAIFILLLLIVGVPWWLRHIVRRIEKASKEGLSPEKHSEDYPGVFHLARYQKKRNWWFYAGQLVERTLLILISVVFSFNDFAFDLAFYTGFFLGMMALLVIWPFAFRQDNMFKALIYGCWGGLSFMRILRRGSFVDQVITITISVFEVLFLVMPLIAFIYLAWKQWGHHLKRAASHLQRGASTLARRIGTATSRDASFGRDGQADTINSSKYSYSQTEPRKRTKNRYVVPAIPEVEPIEEVVPELIEPEMEKKDADIPDVFGTLHTLPSSTRSTNSEDTIDLKPNEPPLQVCAPMEPAVSSQRPTEPVISETVAAEILPAQSVPGAIVIDVAPDETTLERLWKSQSKSNVGDLSSGLRRDVEVVEPGANVEWLQALYPGVDEFVTENKSARTDEDNPSMTRPAPKTTTAALPTSPLTSPLRASTTTSDASLTIPPENMSRRLSLIDKIKSKFSRSPSSVADYNMSIARSLSQAATMSTIESTSPVNPESEL
jgi:hypothetical protein